MIKKAIIDKVQEKLRKTLIITDAYVKLTLEIYEEVAMDEKRKEAAEWLNNMSNDERIIGRPVKF